MQTKEVSAKSGGAVKYPDCIYAAVAGKMSVLNNEQNNLMVQLQYWILRNVEYPIIAIILESPDSERW